MTKSKKILNKVRVIQLHYQKMGLINLANYIFQRLFIPKNHLVKISIPGYNHPVYVRNNPSDTQIFTQIFLREELKIALKKPPGTIIDGGANIGLATVYLKIRYPDAKIIAVEPDHSNFEMLLKNTRPFENIVCYNKGIWNSNTKLKIINKDAGNESFVLNAVDINEINTDTIDAITINSIVKDNNIKNIELLKLDIEGSERRVFEDNYLGWLSITDHMLVEIHNWIDSEAEKIIMSVVESDFSIIMKGEYHFFSKLSNNLK